MGKDWYWGRSSRNEEKEATGCMSGMIHLLDFHHLLFTTTSSPTPPQNQHDSPPLIKGLEAPRNSLELDETAAANASTSAIGEHDNDIPFGVHLVSAPSSGKKIKKELAEWVEEEKRNSQAATPRTPNVVARLMGLEVLPDGASTPTAPASEPISQYHSPNAMTKKKVVKKKHCVGESPPPRQPLQRRDCNIRFDTTAGSRSLPETPRASSERSRDCNPRLSLQLNKENQHRGVKEYCEFSGDRSLPPSPCSYMKNGRRKDSKVQDENKSPRSRYNAREIVKQVKESISRRGSSGNDENMCKYSTRTRMAPDKNATGDSGSKYSTAKSSPSRSPPLQEFHAPKPPLPPKPTPAMNPIPSVRSIENLEDKEKMKSRNCKKACYDRFNEKIKRHTPPPPATASRSALSATRGKNFPTPYHGFSYKKEPSHETHRQPPEIVHPHSSTLETQEQSAIINQKSFIHCRPKSKEQDPEFLYVRSILECAGITGTTPARWFSPPLPIDPFIFHQLELDLPLFQSSNKDTLLLLGPIRHRCNRKLLFHLVEEILGEISGWSVTQRSNVDQQQHKRIHEINKELLLEQLWIQIKGFPLANCQVIGDIDALVNGDLEEAKVRRLLQHLSVIAEAEKIALEIERDVLDSVLGEVASSLLLITDCSPSAHMVRES